ncbi:MAG: hypothetical protein KTR25_16875 [Myxococcales bacterium]|nr:hypothetical protein [Myxococcales bacterium]
MSTEESQKKGYEVTDAKTSPVVVSLVVLVLLMVAGFIGGAVFQSVFVATELRSRPEPNPLVQREEVDGPLLQAHPEVELEAYLTEQRHLQTSYGWVDKALQRVRIPIDEAIAIVARDGLPQWKVTSAKLPEAEDAESAPTPEVQLIETSEDHGVEAVEQPEQAGSISGTSEGVQPAEGETSAIIADPAAAAPESETEAASGETSGVASDPTSKVVAPALDSPRTSDTPSTEAPAETTPTASPPHTEAPTVAPESAAPSVVVETETSAASPEVSGETQSAGGH